MYKTVRQGENSLQYTILPQTEEVLNNSGMKGKGRDYSPSIHVRRRRSRDDTSVAKALLIAFCIVVVMIATMIGSIWLLNYYLMYKARTPVQKYTLGEAERAASYALAMEAHQEDVAKSRKKELRISEASSTLQALQDSKTMETSAETITTTAPTTTASTATTTDKRTKLAWSMPTFKQFDKSNSTTPSITPPPPPIPVVEDQDELNIPNGPFSRLRYANRNQLSDVVIRPVTTDPTTGATRKQVHTFTRVEATYLPTPTTEQERVTSQETLLTTKWGTVVAQPLPKDDGDEHGNQEDHGVNSDKTYPAGKDLKDIKESILEDEEDFKELEVDEVFSLPPLKKDGLEKERPGWMETGDDVTVTKTTSPKIRNMWPFEPSLSLFQWPDSFQEDSMVIPLLVATATLLTVALVLTAVVVRRRRDQAKGATHIGKLTADLQADDNTNLLTAESQEEE